MSQITFRLAVAIFAAVLGMVQFGYNIGVINAPEESIKAFLRSSFKSRYGLDLSDSMSQVVLSVAVASATVGGMMGSLAASILAVRFGPKTSILYGQAVSILAATSMALCKVANSYELLLFGRLMAGVSGGLFSGTVPLYITEISPLSIRGSLGGVTQIANTSGILLSMVLGLQEVLGDDNFWPLVLALIAVPACIQIVLLPFVPESPKYLILTMEDFEGGKQALASLRGRTVDEVKDEAAAIYKDAGREHAVHEVNLTVLKLLKTKELYLPLFLAVCIHMSQKISGMVAIYYYSTNFFITAGIQTTDAQYATLGVGSTVVFTTLMSVMLIDRLGRRTLLLVGIGGMFISCILITVALNVNIYQPAGVKQVEPSGIFLVASIIIFVVFYSLGPGPIAWLITGELFTHGSRPAANSVAVFANWSSNLIVSLLFPIVHNNFPLMSFIPFMVVLFVLFFIFLFYLPETKGLEVAEIAELFQVENAWTVGIGLRGRKRDITPRTPDDTK